MQHFFKKYLSLSTKRSIQSKNAQEDNYIRAVKVESSVEQNDEGKDTAVELDKNQAYAFRKKSNRKGDEFHEQDEDWLEIYNIENKEAEAKFENNCNEYVSEESADESFSGQFNLSINSSLEKFDSHEVRDSLQPLKIVEADMIHQSIIVKSEDAMNIEQFDSKANIQSEESQLVLSLPPLESLPVRPIEISSRSSVLSYSSLNASMVGTEDENATHVRISDSGRFTISESLIPNSMDSKSDADTFSACNEQTNGSDTETGYFQNETLNVEENHVEENQSTRVLQNIKPVAKNSNYTQSEQTFQNFASEKGALDPKESNNPSNEKNRNVNNISNEDLELKLDRDRIKSLPPLPPTRRRSRTLSHPLVLQCINTERPLTPPSSYQRHELLRHVATSQQVDQYSEPHGPQKFCFPYPSLVRFPAPKIDKSMSKIPTTGEGENTETEISRDVSQEIDTIDVHPAAAKVTSRKDLEKQPLKLQTNAEEDIAVDKPSVPKTSKEKVEVDAAEKERNVMTGAESPVDARSCDRIPVLSCCSLL